MKRKPFTPAEANALVPVLEDAFRRIDGQKEEARTQHDRLQVLELLWGDALKDAENPDHAEAEAYGAAIARAVSAIREIVREEILDRGLRFPQGGLAEGLVDFPSTWEGRWVYLCWRRGEASVGAWHEIEDGFAGRQAITPEHAARMGIVDDPSELDDSARDF